MSHLRRTTAAVLTALSAASALWTVAALTNAAVGIGPAASAQEAGGGQRRGQFFAKLLMSVHPPLNDAQKAEIRRMRDDMRRQYQGQPPPADPAARRARFEAFMDKIRGVLTPDQRRDFDAKLAAARARMKNQGQH